MNSNKQEGVGAAMGEEYRKKMFAEEKLAMAGDKGARGTKIDPNLRVNEKQRTGTSSTEEEGGGRPQPRPRRARAEAVEQREQPTTWR